MEANVYGMETETIFASNETSTQIKRENFIATSNNVHGDNETISPFARRAPFQNSGTNDLYKFIQKDRISGEMSTATSDMGETLNFTTSGTEVYEDTGSNFYTATATSDMGETLNFTTSGTEVYEDTGSNFYTGATQSNPGSWNERNGRYSERTINETFDFLVRSLLSANNFVSLLSREQLEVLRSISPNLLCALLQEVAKLRCDRRIRRASPNECAFCKNNGESEEHYSSHALKDGRGRVLCPVLRAFRCPRCGATGDRAHTIKYCPEIVETGSDRSSLSWRRPTPSTIRVPSNSAAGHPLYTPTRTPSPSPSVMTIPNAMTIPTSAVWSGFGLN